MSAITRNRELSQLGSFIYIDDTTKSISITQGSPSNVGIGSTIPTSKLDVFGDVNISGVVTATSFYGSFSGSFENVNYATSAGIATTAIGLTTTSSINTSGIITASSITATAFYINETPLVDPILQTWLVGVGSSIYRLDGNIGIGTSFPSEKLSVIGNVSANRFISTVSSGTAPFSVTSNTLVTNLNSDFLRGKTPPSGDIVGTTDTQTLTNKTLTSPALNSATLSTPTIGNDGANFSGNTGTTNLRASTSASGTLSLPAATDTLVARNTSDTLTNKTIAAGSNTISGLTNSNLSGTAGITNANLATPTISGVSLGSNLNSLTVGSYLSLDSGTTYNGSTSRTITVRASSLNTDPANFPVVARNSSGDFDAGTVNVSYLNATFAVTAADFNSTSDLDLKTNVNTVENALQTVNSLRGVSFDWKNNGKKSYGVIAQELEKILPDLVTTQQNKSVNYNGLVGVLIQAVKELSAEVEELKKKVS